MPVINDIQDMEKITVADLVRAMFKKLNFQKMMLDEEETAKKPLEEQEKDIDWVIELSESVDFLNDLREVLIGMGYERVIPLEFNKEDGI